MTEDVLFAFLMRPDAKKPLKCDVPSCCAEIALRIDGEQYCERHAHARAAGQRAVASSAGIIQ